MHLLIVLALSICAVFGENPEEMPFRTVQTSSVPPGAQGLVESIDSLFTFDDANPRVGQHSTRKCQKHKDKVCVFGAERVEDKSGNLLSAMVAWVNPDLSIQPTYHRQDAIKKIHRLLTNHKNAKRNIEEEEAAKKSSDKKSSKSSKNTKTEKSTSSPKKVKKVEEVKPVKLINVTENYVSELVIYPSSNEIGEKHDYLAWHIREKKSYDTDWNCMVDAAGGDVLSCWNNIQTVLNRKTYDAKETTFIPGTLVRTESSATSNDDCLNIAHDNAKATYDFYKNIYNRDSYDDKGATIVSSVHYNKKYNNAFWSTVANQMVYGDGDGVYFKCLAYGLDIVGHELTHAVTATESALLYQGESGAINEGISDVLGAAIELYANDTTLTNWNNDTFTIGETAWTPTISGDALRYLCNPRQAGDTNADFYPERYQGKEDNGGVHRNSGIVTLAFCLLVKGGYHPRGKSSNYVQSINFKDAVDVFYYANANFLAASAKFSDLRAGTLQVATDTWGTASQQYISIYNAWDAVGVYSPDAVNASTKVVVDANSGIGGLVPKVSIVTPTPTPTPTPISVEAPTSVVTTTTTSATSNVCWGKVASGTISAMTRIYVPNSRGFTSTGVLIKGALGGDSRNSITLVLEKLAGTTWTPVQNNKAITIQNTATGTYRWYLQSSTKLHFSFCYTQD